MGAVRGNNRSPAARGGPVTAARAVSRLSHLDRLEAEAIHILREGVAEGRKPVMLFSAGKDSTVLAHLALRAFYPSPPPFPLLHVDSTWEFRSLIAFRDAFAERHGFELVVYANEVGRAAGLNPLDHGDAYTTAMRTDALKQALDLGGYDIIFGGARRDEERSRAKERIFSVRNEHHGWDPRQQRPELWQSFNTRLAKGQSLRVFPLSNWTETDIWAYALSREIELAPLYFAEPRPVIERDGALIVVDDLARLPLRSGENATTRTVRFRTLGCWPVTAAMESGARDLTGVIRETLTAGASERQGRLSDRDGAGSLERQKQEGYF
ncbi:sulfate adenylyltransferase subunit CysD [Qipengyuania sp. XHP0207]|uniref:sulfate adenylyltransferase subunit CysD n=1 Tax=Qipengyuania sp. XHP0207 TaxID=3038078 RepID=UPI00241D5708|nr:sulfate adenylyltransferase subunit CysD [Qipengyuania sp. XHP0207]MDG5746603.1 sulfate adenylyltransferase subunit CysD [Qipengyuania sp. XHP0207]